MDIEQNADYIYIGEGRQPFNRESPNWRQLTGNLETEWRWDSTGPSIIIIFTSDGKGTGRGFWFECMPRKYLEKSNL